MSRSAKATSNASDAAGEGGMGAPIGISSETFERSRTPRSMRKSCINSAVSLGAGGHLNGVEVTPTITSSTLEGREHIS